jgi:hypothetical protein
MRLRLGSFMFVAVYCGYSGWLMTQVFPSLDQRFRIVTAALDALLVLLALTVIFRNREYYGVRLLLIFLLAAAVTVIYNSDKIGFLAQINGLRQPIFFLCALIVINDLVESDLRERFIAAFTLFLIIWGVSQIPTSVYQYLKYGANDNVGGTYGLTGGSGLVTQLVFLIAFYLVTRYGATQNGEGFKLSRVLAFSFLFIPCALNETKVSFLLLALYIIMLAGVRRVWRTIPVLVIGGVLLYAFIYYYQSTVGGVDEITSDKFLYRYLFYDPRQNTDIPRIQKVFMAVQLVSKDIVSFFFGTGYGLFSGSNLLGTSRFGRSLSYFSGTRSLLSTMWLEGGLISVLVFGAATTMFFRPTRLKNFVERRFALFVLVSLLLVWVYNEAVLDRMFALVVGYFMVLLYNGTLHEDPGTAQADVHIPADEPSAIDGGNA